MKLKIGDRVRFLNETGGGIVKRFLDNQMVEVETADGWAIPYVPSELVVMPDDPKVEPYRAESNPPVIKEAGSKKRQRVDDNTSFNILLLAIRDADKNGVFSGVRWYLVNDSEFLLTFSFYQEDNTGISCVESDVLDPGTKIFLQELELADLSEVKGFHVQGLLTMVDSSTIPPLVSRYVPYNTKKFGSAGAYTSNDYLHEDALSFNATVAPRPIEPEMPIPIETGDVKPEAPKLFKSGNKQDKPKEVDLHINQLVESVIGMSNREILKIQMKTFEKELGEAIKIGQKSIVFIHGIGNGTLKESLRKSLDNDYPICSHEDGSFKDYGFGATMVRIRQNR